MLDCGLGVFGPKVRDLALPEHEVPCVGLAGEEPTEEAEVGALLSLWAEGASCRHSGGTVRGFAPRIIAGTAQKAKTPPGEGRVFKKTVGVSGGEGTTVVVQKNLPSVCFWRMSPIRARISSFEANQRRALRQLWQSSDHDSLYLVCSLRHSAAGTALTCWACHHVEFERAEETTDLCRSNPSAKRSPMAGVSPLGAQPESRKE
jgi:hypothetical protein